MKLILLVSFVFSVVLSAQSQLVVGSFHNSKYAQNTKVALSDFVKNSRTLQNIFDKKSLKVDLKEHKGYFIVTIEPFRDMTTKLNTLNIIKTKYPDTYSINLPVEKKIVIEEPKPVVKEIPIEVVKTRIEEEILAIEKEIQEETLNLKDEIKNNLVSEIKVKTKIDTNASSNTFVELILILVTLLLLVAYLLINKKNRCNKVSSDKSKKNSNENIEQNSKTETVQKTTRIKKDVPAHEKIQKDDFKKFAGTRILVAEDNNINQKVISGLLAGSNIDITMVNDGQEVLDTLEEDRNYSLLLMDIHMPNVDGYEATREIRKNPKYNHIVIVAFSGDIATDDVRKMLDAGMDEQIEKPLKMDDLYDIIYAYHTDIAEANQKNTSSEPTALNIEKGLSICSGDETFYNEILDDFVKNYANSTNKLNFLLDGFKMLEVDQLLLDLSGITANIGADTLNETIIQLKASLKNMEEKPTMLIEQYEIQLQNVLKEISIQHNL